MKPASFDYYAPTTVDEALALLEANGPDSRLLAGGQSLVPMMNFRLAAPPVIVDLNRIPDLAYIEDHGDVVCIGAMTRQRAVESSALVADKLPMLSAAIKLVGHLPTRSRGTIGGSIAHADPAAELPMVLQALDGAVVVRGPNGRRTIAASELFQDAMTTSIAADEILVEVRLPVMPAGAARRGSVDVAGATTVTLGLASIVFAIVRAPQAGWTSASTLVAGFFGLVLIGVFVARQAKATELQRPPPADRLHHRFSSRVRIRPRYSSVLSSPRA